MPVEKKEPLGMSRDRAKPVCFPGVSCLRRVLGLSNAVTCHSRSTVTIVTTLAQLTGAARDSKARNVNAQFSGWRCVSCR